MSGSFITPPGQFPPLTVVTETNHTAWIAIATSLGLPIILLFGVIRIFVRRAVRLGLDDILIAAATAIAIIQSIVVLCACRYGLGETVDDIQQGALKKVQQMYYVSNILLIVALALSKASVTALLLRLCATKTHKIIFKAAMLFLILWTVASIFAVALQCELEHPWILVHATCPAVLARWQGIGIVDIAFEIFVVAMSISLVWGLNTTFSTKRNVVLAFSLRLLLLIVIAFRLATFPTHTLTTDPILHLDLFIIWTQTEMNWSIISATLPSLRPFLRDLSTFTGEFYGSTTDPTSRYPNHRSASSAFQLSDLGSKSRAEGSVGGLSRARAVPGTVVTSGTKGNDKRSSALGRSRGPVEGDAISIGSTGSQKMFIRKDVTYEVDYNDTGERSRDG